VRDTKLLADCYLRRGADKKVIELLDPVADKRPDDPGAAYLLGMALLRENQEERGVHILERIMSRKDTDRRAPAAGDDEDAGSRPY
jgi:Flp pilus assembly protein TadD